MINQKKKKQTNKQTNKKNWVMQRGLGWGKKIVSKGEKLPILTALIKWFSRNSGPVWFVQSTSKGFK
jgi:hypothetical protein